jgi:hypothetical protein
MLAVRTEGDPLRFVNAIRGEVLAIDRDQPITAVKTMDSVVEESEGQRRSIMVLMGLFPAKVTTVTTIWGLAEIVIASIAGASVYNE